MTASSKKNARDPDSNRFAHILEEIGYAVSKVTVSIKKSCDLAASFANEQILAEVKRFQSFSDDHVGGQEQLPRRRVFDVEHSSAKHKVLSYGAEQLRSTASVVRCSSQLMCVRLEGPYGVNALLDLMATVFGVRWVHLAAGRLRSLENVVPVFFAGRSWFARHKEVQAILISKESRIVLWLNPSANGLQGFKATRLFQVLHAEDAVVDIATMGQTEPIYVGEPQSGDPKEADVLRYLRRTYLVEGKFVSLQSETTVWPNNAMGSYTPIPGCDCGVDLFMRRALEKFAE